jgi:hypothetical protein
MYYRHYDTIINKKIFLMFGPVVFAAVVPDEDGQRSAHDDGQEPAPSRSQTPPTPPVQPASPPACTRPLRQRAMAQLRPVSIPEIVRDMAGSDPLQKIAALDRHYMPEGQPAAEVSSRGTSDAHRAELKQNATGISRSLSEVFAYLTHGTASLEEARKLLSIITNVLKLCTLYALHLIYIL